MAKKIDESVLDELLKGCERPEDLLGDGGLMKDLKKALMQRMLGAELTEHPGAGRRLSGLEPSQTASEVPGAVQTMHWVDWYTETRLLSSIGYGPPAEAERRHLERTGPVDKVA
jgi:transposase InsO family protein